MKQYEATEIAYKNGYEKGKADGALEAFEWLEEKGFLNIEVWAIQDVKAEIVKKYIKESVNNEQR